MESHGTLAQLRASLAIACKRHVLLHSPCVDNGISHEGAGGCIFLVHKSYFEDLGAIDPVLLGLGFADPRMNVQVHHLLPGRVAVLAIDNGKCVHFCFLVHNFGFAISEIRFFETYFNKLVSTVRSNTTRYSMSMGGDFNLIPSGERKVVVAEPLSPWVGIGEVDPSNAIAAARPFQARWEKYSI